MSRATHNSWSIANVQVAGITCVALATTTTTTTCRTIVVVTARCEAVLGRQLLNVSRFPFEAHGGGDTR